MRIVIAVGGNALLQRGQPADAVVQEGNVRIAAAAIAAVAADHQVILTHGNGPQVGLLASESEHDASLQRPYPLDVLDAETEGMIGYWLERELLNQLPDRRIVTVLTQTLVDAADPAFERPTKFVGPVFSAERARSLAARRGWTIAPDGGYWRRVVPSPAPLEFLELPAIRGLVDRDVVVICAGGGGIPVIREGGVLRGAEAVVDKDRAAALLATQLHADALLLLTDVDAVQLDYGTPQARPIGEVTVDELRRLPFPDGSMGPKVEAACSFIEAGGLLAGIGALGAAAKIAAGVAGTVVRPASLLRGS